MNSKDYFEEMKKIQENILDYLDYENDVEEKYQDIKNIFDDIKIHDNQYKIKSLMYLLVRISCDHHREEGFFSKIERIIKLFKDDLQKYFSNSELFHIFKGSSRILLFLIEDKIIIFDEFIANQIKEDDFFYDQYIDYFQPEIKFVKEKLSDDFKEKRKIGENSEIICKLIQKDLIGEFITYVNKNSYSLKSKINQSVYETNDFLIINGARGITLIEYAAFYGSIQIFKYLISKDVELTPSLWFYAVHGKDPEIMKILEENESISPDQDTFQLILRETIKCHHINVSNYIFDNYLRDEDENKIDDDILINSIIYYNFNFIENDKINERLFCCLCAYDYYIPVFNMLSTKYIDINQIIISFKLFLLIMF